MHRWHYEIAGANAKKIFGRLNCCASGDGQSIEIKFYILFDSISLVGRSTSTNMINQIELCFYIQFTF